MTSEESTHYLLGNKSVKNYLSLSPIERQSIRTKVITLVNPIHVLGASSIDASSSLQPDDFLAQLNCLCAVRSSKPDVRLDELIAEYQRKYFEDNHFVVSLHNIEQIPSDGHQTGLGAGDVASLIRFITIGVDISDTTEAILRRMKGIYRFTNATSIVVELYRVKGASDTSVARIQDLLGIAVAIKDLRICFRPRAKIHIFERIGPGELSNISSYFDDPTQHSIDNVHRLSPTSEEAIQVQIMILYTRAYEKVETAATVNYRNSQQRDLA